MTFNPLIIGAIQSSGAGGFEYSTTGSPTDGTYTLSGTTYRILVWTSSGSLTFSTEARAAEYLLIAAGGGGGGSGASGGRGGGGGGGAVIYESGYNIAVGTYDVTIGAGGAGGSGIVFIAYPT